MSLNIFLSHAWNDKELAAFKAIESKLADAGYKVWVDKHQIEYGESITPKIEEGIRSADVVLVLWSRNAHRSEAVLMEIETARRLERRLIPCKITDYEPGKLPQFRDRKYLSFDGHRLPIGLLQLSQFLSHLRIRGNTAMQSDDQLLEQVEALDGVLAEFEDWGIRKERGASGNEASDAYINRMLELGKKLVQASGDSPDEKARLIQFFAKVQAISAKYPHPSQNDIKNASLAGAIDEADPHGQSQMLQTFKAMLAQMPASEQPAPPSLLTKPPLIQQIENHIQSVRQLPGSNQLLRQRLAEIVPPAQVAQVEAVLQSMIDAVPQLLTVMVASADQAQVGHLLAPIIQAAAQYFLQPQDLIPDSAGALGLIDDTYLVHAFVFEVNGHFTAQTGQPLVAVNIGHAIQLMRAVLGPAITQQLDQAVVQSVQQVIQQSYAQQLAQWQQANGMPAVQPDPEQWSWGQTHEDEIARLSAKIRCGY